jgi:hypothetical protein
MNKTAMVAIVGAIVAAISTITGITLNINSCRTIRKNQISDLKEQLLAYNSTITTQIKVLD